MNAGAFREVRAVFETILVAIGANLPTSGGRTPLETCGWAVERLALLPGLRLRRASRWFETRPVPASDQPSFINGAAWLTGTAEPLSLLAALQDIENTAGRVRSTPNAARVLDLDLLAMDGLVMTTPALVLPHPRLWERAFVLAPLCDVRPEWRHPVLNLSAKEMLSMTATAGVRAL